MNQNSIFAEPIPSVSESASNRVSNWLVLALVLACVGSPANAFAQGPPTLPPEILPARNTTASFNSWTPPGSRPAENLNASFEQAQAPANNGGFPDAPYGFGTSERLAANTNATQPVDSSLESTIDTTAEMLSNLSDSVGEKTSGWMASINQNGGWISKIQSLFGSTETAKMLGSLALVLGLYFAFVWVMRKISPGGERGLPAEVVSVMGQVPFGPRRNLQLVRLGSKLVLLMNSPEGTQPIGEINDALEVEYLTSLCPGKRQSPTGFSAIHQAAKRLAESTNGPSTTPPGTPANTSLSQVIRMLESASKQGGAVFEA